MSTAALLGRLGVPAGVVARLPSPCLLVDLATAEANSAAMAARFAGRAVRLRPHFKAHKCTRLMARQVAAGEVSGVTCATAQEAVVLARAGFADILVANEVVGAPALGELAEAASIASSVTVAVDDERHVADLVRLVADTGITLGVLVEVDVGQGRCGVAPHDRALVALAAAVTAADGLTFRGLEAYAGHAALIVDPDARRAQVERAAAAVATARRALAAAGLPCDLVTGGATGTCADDLAAGHLDEIQAGSYVLMDSAYTAVDASLGQALLCLAMVVSRRDGRCIADAGLKHLSVEHGMPATVDQATTVRQLNDEHAVIDLAPGADAPAVGDRIALVPSHVDPTVNLHDALVVWDRRSGTAEAWPVDGRRRVLLTPR